MLTLTNYVTWRFYFFQYIIHPSAPLSNAQTRLGPLISESASWYEGPWLWDKAQTTETSKLETLQTERGGGPRRIYKTMFLPVLQLV